MTKFGPWKIWNGGECPVEPEKQVQLQFANQTRMEAERGDTRKASVWIWCHTSGPGDIIAYREVIEPVVETMTVRGTLDLKPDDRAPTILWQHNFTVTYCHGVPIKIHWEADQ